MSPAAGLPQFPQSRTAQGHRVSGPREYWENREVYLVKRPNPKPKLLLALHASRFPLHALSGLPSGPEPVLLGLQSLEILDEFPSGPEPVLLGLQSLEILDEFPSGCLSADDRAFLFWVRAVPEGPARPLPD